MPRLIKRRVPIKGTKTPLRKRAVRKVVSQVSPKLKLLCNKLMVANGLKNEAAAVERARAKEVTAEIARLGIKEDTIPLAGGFSITIETGASESSVVDIKKLQKHTTPEQFMEIVSASQAAVTEVVGTAVLKKCLVTTMGAVSTSFKLNRPKK